MKIVDIVDAVRGTADIDKKFEYVITGLATASVANMNALLLLIDAVQSTPGFDKAALKRNLEEQQATAPTSKDVNGPMYSQLMGLFLSRLT